MSGYLPAGKRAAVVSLREQLWARLDVVKTKALDAVLVDYHARTRELANSVQDPELRRRLHYHFSDEVTEHGAIPGLTRTITNSKILRMAFGCAVIARICALSAAYEGNSEFGDAYEHALADMLSRLEGAPERTPGGDQ